VKTFPFVAAKCSSIRAGIFCSFPPGLCSRESHPVENMSSGEAAAAGTAAEEEAVAFEVFAFASCRCAQLVSPTFSRMQVGIES
jgi:hypothetical protein